MLSYAFLHEATMRSLQSSTRKRIIWLDCAGHQPDLGLLTSKIVRNNFLLFTINLVYSIFSIHSKVPALALTWERKKQWVWKQVNEEYPVVNTQKYPRTYAILSSIPMYTYLEPRRGETEGDRKGKNIWINDKKLLTFDVKHELYIQEAQQTSKKDHL